MCSSFPEYVPEWLGAYWKTMAREAHDIHLAGCLMCLGYAKDQRAAIKKNSGSIGLPSLLAKLLGDQEGPESDTAAGGFTDIESAHLGNSLIGAAVDNTAVTSKSLMLLFAAHPEIMHKAQAETDRVGNGRPPQADQLTQLTYLRACILSHLMNSSSACPHDARHLGSRSWAKIERLTPFKRESGKG